MATVEENNGEANAPIVDVRDEVYDFFRSLAPDVTSFFRQPLPAASPDRKGSTDYYYSAPREEIVTRQNVEDQIELEVRIDIVKIFEKEQTVNSIYKDVNDYSRAVLRASGKGRDFLVVRREVIHQDQIIETARVAISTIVFIAAFTEQYIEPVVTTKLKQINITGTETLK